MILAPYGKQYLPYQLDGIRFAASRPSALIADEMGLGKTIQAIGVINTDPQIESVLVVCPASLVPNWHIELDRWLVSPCVDVTVVSYGTLRKALGKHYDVAILDEAHYIKERNADRSKAARCIHAKRKIALTGTPLLNRPKELWHLLHWLDSDRFPWSSYHSFGVRYCAAFQQPIYRKSPFGPAVITKKVWNYDGASNLEELAEVLRPLQIRRLKAEVLPDLPVKRRQILELPEDGIDVFLRRRARKAAEDILALQDTYADDAAALESHLRVAFQDLAGLRQELGLAKVPMAAELIADAAEVGKVVVFAHHRKVIADLAAALADHNPVVVTGDTPPAERQAAVEAFQDKKDVRVFVGQIQAAGVGLTLTAAHHVIFAEVAWSAGVMRQAEDRCHRIGQHQPVFIQHLVLQHSLDAQIVKALVRKQEITETVLDSTPTEKEN
jgi:SWI/SNF-related matrix-associated actin-dependent regulator 1 of chromatin subfamily A